MINWNIKTVKISELKLLENNPRIIKEKEFQQLKEDLKDGKYKPFVIDTNNVILAGNQSYRAMLEMPEYGVDCDVLVSYPDKELTTKQRNKIILLDNKHRGEDDLEILANEFEDDLKELGFENILPKNFDTSNSEISTDSFEDIGILVFKLPSSDYMKALQLLANAVEKTESESNEECLMKLLNDYE